MGMTRLWWLAVACLLLAIGLVIWSLPPQGTRITISFPEGHGLKAEDAVRYRGIDVGVVESVELPRAMDSVQAHVNLLPSAKRLAVEGSRFWIVRPQLSISGVSGLETAVGHKYIEVIPGLMDSRLVTKFEGLAQPPADSTSSNGIEILLQADARHSVRRGSAIHYRGVDIGRVLAVELSQDSRHVEVRGKIEEAYRSLVTTESRFWATGGVDVDFSLREGLKLETESLDTLARGGVSMLVVGNGKSVAPGHVFPLAEFVNEDWLAKADKFRTTTADLRGCINLEASWEQKVIFRNWNKDGRRLPLNVSNVSIESPVATLALESDVEKLIGTDSVSTTSTPAQAVVVRKSAENQMYLHLPIAASEIGLVQEGDVELWRLVGNKKLYFVTGTNVARARYVAPLHHFGKCERCRKTD